MQIKQVIEIISKESGSTIMSIEPKLRRYAVGSGVEYYRLDSEPIIIDKNAFPGDVDIRFYVQHITGGNVINKEKTLLVDALSKMSQNSIKVSKSGEDLREFVLKNIGENIGEKNLVFYGEKSELIGYLFKELPPQTVVSFEYNNFPKHKDRSVSTAEKRAEKKRLSSKIYAKQKSLKELKKQLENINKLNQYFERGNIHAPLGFDKTKEALSENMLKITNLIEQDRKLVAEIVDEFKAAKLAKKKNIRQPCIPELYDLKQYCKNNGIIKALRELEISENTIIANCYFPGIERDLNKKISDDIKGHGLKLKIHKNILSEWDEKYILAKIAVSELRERISKQWPDHKDKMRQNAQTNNDFFIGKPQSFPSADNKCDIDLPDHDPNEKQKDEVFVEKTVIKGQRQTGDTIIRFAEIFIDKAGANEVEAFRQIKSTGFEIEDLAGAINDMVLSALEYSIRGIASSSQTNKNLFQYATKPVLKSFIEQRPDAEVLTDLTKLACARAMKRISNFKKSSQT